MSVMSLKALATWSKGEVSVTRDWFTDEIVRGEVYLYDHWVVVVSRGRQEALPRRLVKFIRGGA